MKRREFIIVLGGGAAYPLATRAQPSERTRRIGVLMGYAESDPDAQANVAAFREGLEKLGWAEGRNIRIDTRWPIPADVESMQRFSKELVALQPDVILSHITPTTAALLLQTRTIPIVFATVSDPVGSGFVASFPQPGGNVTGFTSIEPTMSGKWLQLLKEIAPRVARVALLFNPATAPYAEFFLNPLKAAAQSSGVEVIAASVRDTSELESVIAALAREPIARRSHRWRLATVYLRSTRSINSPKSVVCYPTETTSAIIIGVRRSMSIASCGARSRASFPSRRRSSSS